MLRKDNFMINKQNLWFITLFSLIMVLSIYYLTMSDDVLSSISVNSNSESETTKVMVSENDALVALKVANEEALVAKLEELQNILLNAEATIEEKNKAYEELQTINKEQATKESIEKKIKETYKLDSIVTIEGTNIKVNVASKVHDEKLANNIIRSIQEMYDKDMYITVKFG